MANKAGTRRELGAMACGCCGKPIPVRESATGTVNASCPWCEVQTWAKSGTRAHALILGRVKAAQAPAQAPAHGTAPPPPSVSPPTPEPKDPPKDPPKAAARSSVFHF